MHRYLGLSLFAATLGKLALYDIWNLPRVAIQMMSVLLAVRRTAARRVVPLRARAGRRLQSALIRDGNVDKAAVILFLTLAATRAYAFDPSTLEFQRNLESVTGPGLYHIEVDADLYRHARSDQLADLRIAGPDGAEIPWLVRPVPPPQRVLSAASHPRSIRCSSPTARRAQVLDLGAPGLQALRGPPRRRRRRRAGSVQARIEVSSDETSWALMSPTAPTSLPSPPPAASRRKRRCALSTSSARYLRA